MNIDQKLKASRKNAGLTQEDLAEKIKVSRQTISSWENGRSYPDILSIILLSDIYGVSLDHLLKGDDQMMKKIEKDTNVVKSNRKLIGIYLACIVGYALLYVLLPLLNIPKLTHLGVNIAILVAVGCGLLFLLIRHLQQSGLLQQSTSNLTLLKALIVAIGVLLIVGGFELLALVTTEPWQIIVGRLLICLVGGGGIYLLCRKIAQK